MSFTKLMRARALYAEKDRIWVAKGMTFFAVDYTGRRVTQKYCVGNTKKRILSSNRLSRQLLREGLHHLLPLKNGNILVTAKRMVYVVSPNGEIVNTFSGYNGNKPGHQGVCVTPDGTVFLGEYTINLDHKNETRLFRSTDHAMNFECVLTFPKNVRHIHFVKYDPYEKCIWIGTGDADNECFLMRSDDMGDTWKNVGGGSQKWRAIGICFDKDSLIWGTDAGSVPDQNYIVRMDRKTCELETVAEVEGPCHGCASFCNGRVFISCGVEGGENEQDRYARLKEIKNGKAEDLLKIKKDSIPLILQYGVMRFPLGTDSTDKVVFTTMGLKNKGEAVLIEK